MLQQAGQLCIGLLPRLCRQASAFSSHVCVVNCRTWLLMKDTEHEPDKLALH